MGFLFSTKEYIAAARALMRPEYMRVSELLEAAMAIGRTNE